MALVKKSHKTGVELKKLVCCIQAAIGHLALAYAIQTKGQRSSR